MTDPKEINFSARKSEPEWQSASDEFFLAATPKLFEWLRWIITLAAISYVYHRSHSWALFVLLAVSYILTGFYFNAFFFQFKFVGVPLWKTPRAARLGSLGVGAVLGLGTWYLATETVRVIVASQP